MKVIGSPVPANVRDRLKIYNRIMKEAVHEAIDENKRLGIVSGKALLEKEHTSTSANAEAEN